MGVQMPLALKAKNRPELENCSYLAICPGQMFDISKSKTSKIARVILQHLSPWNYLVHNVHNQNKCPCDLSLLALDIPKNQTKKVFCAMKVAISMPQDISALTVSLWLKSFTL